MATLHTTHTVNDADAPPDGHLHVEMWSADPPRFLSRARCKKQLISQSSNADWRRAPRFGATGWGRRRVGGCVTPRPAPPSMSERLRLLIMLLDRLSTMSKCIHFPVGPRLWLRTETLPPPFGVHIYSFYVGECARCASPHRDGPARPRALRPGRLLAPPHLPRRQDHSMCFLSSSTASRFLKLSQLQLNVAQFSKREP